MNANVNNAQGEQAGVPRLALRQVEAAQSLGVSLDFFIEHIEPELRVVRRGRCPLYPVSELARWLDSTAAGAFDNPARRRRVHLEALKVEGDNR